MNKTLIAALALLGSTSVFSQHTINVSSATFARPLVEKWVAEYQKENPDFHANVVSDKQAKGDASVVLSGENSSAVVGRYIILPIANSANEILQNKKVRKGLDSESEQKLFFKSDDIEELYNERNDKTAQGTVYALAGAKSVTTALFAKQLNVDPSKLKGKKILGKEENALSAVLKNADALSFNVANLVYAQDGRQPIDGVSVLTVDLNGNGRVSEDERQAFENIDALLNYVENVGAKGVAIGNVSIESADGDVAEFVKWVSTRGQSYVNEYGFLKTEAQLRAQR